MSCHSTAGVQGKARSIRGIKCQPPKTNRTGTDSCYLASEFTRYFLPRICESSKIIFLAYARMLRTDQERISHLREEGRHMFQFRCRSHHNSDSLELRFRPRTRERGKAKRGRSRRRGGGMGSRHSGKRVCFLWFSREHAESRVREDGDTRNSGGTPYKRPRYSSVSWLKAAEIPVVIPPLSSPSHRCQSWLAWPYTMIVRHDRGHDHCAFGGK